MLQNLIYALIVIVLVMIVIDFLGRRKQQAQARTRRRKSRAADDAPLSAWGSAMNPRTDFPPTVFDDEEAKFAVSKRAYSTQSPAEVIQGLQQRRAARNTFGTPDAELATARAMPGAGPVPAPATARLRPLEDPLDRSVRNSPSPSPATARLAFNSVRLLSLTGPDQGKTFPVLAAGTLVGRHPSCQIVIGDRRVSGRHAWLGIALDKVILRDLDSTNGTQINKHPDRVIGETELHAGDTVYLGGPKGVQFQVLID